MEWNCTDTDKRLSDYLELQTSPEESAVVRAHLENCAECSDLVARVRATLQLLGSAKAVPVPADLLGKIVAVTSQPTVEARSWRRWIGPAPMAWQPQFAMGAITIAASFLIIFQATNTSRGPQALSSINPLTWLREANRQAHLTYAHTAKFVDNLRVVYEIQTRLGNNGDDQPAAAPAQDPNSNLPVAVPQSEPAAGPGRAVQPRHKSELVPHQSRETRARAVVASDTQRRNPTATAIRSHT